MIRAPLYRQQSLGRFVSPHTSAVVLNSCRPFLFAATTVLRDPNRMSPETARKVREEDRSDYERERQLREKFAQKLQQAMPSFNQQQQQTQNTGSTSGPSTGGPFAQKASNPNEPRLKLLRFAFFGLSIYLVVLINRMRSPDSPMMQMQQMPWWQAPVDVLAASTLIRHLISLREQRSIKTEYEAQCKSFPGLSLTQFLSRQYPNLLAGHRTAQSEIIAALCACFAVSRDVTFADIINRGVKAYPRDPKAAIDKIMDLLRVEYPQIFAPVVPTSPSLTMPAFAGATPSMLAHGGAMDLPQTGTISGETSGTPVVWNMASTDSLAQKPIA